jgi:hypothetical protein
MAGDAKYLWGDFVGNTRIFTNAQWRQAEEES